jgi:hypothetical protein
MLWEPGMAYNCSLCGRAWVYNDPPSQWMRHRPSHRRRVPIWGDLPGLPLGYMEYVYP